MRHSFIVLCILLAFIVSGCGGPKEDVSIFMMPENGVSSEVNETLKQSLADAVGSTPTVGLYGSAMFNLQKLVVEIAAGGHGILIVTENEFKGYGRQGGFVNLENLFDTTKYPKGVIEANEGTSEKEKLVKHLYGIPMEQTGWFTKTKLNGEGLYAFIPSNAPDVEKAKRVLKTIVEMK